MTLQIVVKSLSAADVPSDVDRSQGSTQEMTPCRRRSGSSPFQFGQGTVDQGLAYNWVRNRGIATRSAMTPPTLMSISRGAWQSVKQDSVAQRRGASFEARRSSRPEIRDRLLSVRH
jgi:hypothetical protein